MTPEVRERIEQIWNGIVPEGYKKTKVGISPCEWDVQPLNKLLEFKNGINADKEKFGQGTKLISVRDVLSDCPITYETIKSAVDVNEQQIEEFGVKYGDILFQRSSENYEDAGTSNVYLDPNNTAVFSGFVIRGKKISEYNPLYLNALLRTFYVRKAIIRQAAGAQHINIGQESLAKVHVALADDSEQAKIAEILTTQDKVIELKEKRLAEKQRQKKYLMQQLLTGKKRLPGFDGEWKRLPFTEVFSFLPTNTLSRDCMSETVGTILNIHYGDVLVKYPEILDTDKIGIPFIKHGFEPSNISYVRNGDVIIADTAEDLSVGKAVEIQNVSQRLIASGLHTMFCRPNHDLFAAGWLGYYINSSVFHDQLLPLISGVKVSSISKKEIIKTTISVPTIEEQRAIANILSVADVEIMLLNQDIEQEKKKKKSLMQLLLTGIVRVNT